nr:hypothetical protein BgiMline_006377 [Biomphalaria glabrata]
MDKVQPLLQRSLVQSAQTDRQAAKSLGDLKASSLPVREFEQGHFFSAFGQNCQHLSKFENGEPSFAVLCRAFSEA